jgi:hypothetical protein
MNYKTKFFNTNLIYIIMLTLFVGVRIVSSAVEGIKCADIIINKYN